MYKNINYVPGHLLRRVLHSLSLLTPYLYYWHGKSIASFFYMTREQFLGFFVGMALLFELVRRLTGIRVYGARHYEKHNVSGAVWLIFSTGLVLLLAPLEGTEGASIGAPIIWSACICDMMMGELRILNFKKITYIISGLMLSSLVWISSAIWLGTIWYLLPFLIPMVVFAEIIDQPGLDDNFTMLFFPLSFVLYVQPWII